MIKKTCLLVLSLLMINFCNLHSFAESDRLINADIGTRRVPQGTLLKLKLIDPLGTSGMSLGDQFDLMTTEDIKVEKSVIIPSGSVIRGSVEKISQRRMLSKGAIMYLDFDHIVSPTGKQVPLKVGIVECRSLTYDGGLGSKTNYGTATVQNLKNTGKIVKVSTKWGWDTGNQFLEGYPKYVLAPMSAIFSAPVAGMYFIGDSIVDLFKKGDDLQLNQGETMKLMLIKPLDMPLY